MEKALQSLGLTETESKVYLSILKQNNSQISDITKQTGMHRRTIYDVIERLIKKGLVGYIKINNTRSFEVINPNKFIDILKEKEENVKSALIELQGLYKGTKSKKETLFFRGKESIKSVFDDQINVGEEILFMGKGVNVNEIIKFYFPRFDAKRIEKNIRIKMIFDCNSKTIQELKKIPLAEIKFIKNPLISPMSIYIYGNSTNIVLWNHDPLAILIREKDIAEGFKEHFNMLWQQATY